MGQINTRESFRMLCNNIKAKFDDHFLIGIEHSRRISDGSPITISMESKEPVFNTNNEKENNNINNYITNKEKLEVVLNDPKFGMFSLFKYHRKRGYLNEQLEKNNVVYCSHIFSLYAALPILIVLSQWMIYISIIANENSILNEGICPNKATWYNKLLMSGIAVLYFVKSLFLWDNLTKRIKLTKVYPCNDIWVVIDTFQEYVFNIMVYGANLWIIFVEKQTQNMIFNSVAMEFIMQLDNDFEYLYFKNLPDAAIDLYDNVFVSPDTNKQLILDKLDKSKSYKFLVYFLYIPFKIIIALLFIFPIFSFLMIIYSPICK